MPAAATKKCVDGKVVNPKTGRCVKIDGAIGKQILQNHGKPKKSAKKDVKKTSPSKPECKKVKNANQLIKLFKQIHPDSYISKDAKEEILTTLAEACEDEVADVIDLAGSVARYDRKKTTVNREDVIKAKAIVRQGKEAIKAEEKRLDEQRIKLLKSQGYPGF